MYVYIYERAKQYIQGMIRYGRIKGFRGSIISTSPRILIVDDDHLTLVPCILDIMPEGKTYIMVGFGWTHESILKMLLLKCRLLLLQKRYPSAEITFLCNSVKEGELCKKFHIPYVYCNKNCLVDEKKFTVIPGIQKRYDAVYNAMISRTKRHYLTRNVKNLALITYFGEPDHYESIKKILPNAQWLNFLDGQYRGFTEDEVARYLNQARAGLCLSKEEGAMYASIEYLLCGLPVVSTRSVGGRDVFFVDEYVKLVDDNPESVERGLEEILSRNIDPLYIRQKTIEKIREHRERFVSYVQGIFDKEKINIDFEKRLESIFFNKMIRWNDKDALQRELSK